MSAALARNNVLSATISLRARSCTSYDDPHAASAQTAKDGVTLGSAEITSAWNALTVSHPRAADRRLPGRGCRPRTPAPRENHRRAREPPAVVRAGLRASAL